MRALNFAPDGRARPAETAVRTAVPCILLIRPTWPGAATRDENRVGPLPSSRPSATTSPSNASPHDPGDFPFRMRSQVQVLAGPPPIVAGQSAAAPRPVAPTGCLGRAGAARPSPPASSSALRCPSTQASTSTTTTHRGRAPSPGRQPRGRDGNLALRLAPVPTAQPPATGAQHAGRACLVSQRASAAARTQPSQVAADTPTDRRDLGSVARFQAPSADARAARRCGSP
jgi:hypothetical protein